MTPDEISAVILRTLHETNAKEYAGEIIERVEHSFSPGAALQLIGKRTVLPRLAVASSEQQAWMEA
jgi:hypothetical protein